MEAGDHGSQRSTWHSYQSPRTPGGAIVRGDLRVLEQVWSPQLRNRRDLLVHLPAGYDTEGRRYPVIYMHDGQNLFDAASSYAGEWRVDETLDCLEREGISAIVVGVSNTGESRIDEYGPFQDPRFGGGLADRYLSFLIDTVKPRIDRDFRTRPDRAANGMMGSSMGGLLSLYGFFRHAGTFGFAGAMSPSLWFADKSIFPFIERASFVEGRLYLDTGTREAERRDCCRKVRAPQHAVCCLSQCRFARCRDTRCMRELLERKGYRPGIDLRYIEERGAGHNEQAWARRLPAALRFLLVS